MNGLESVAIGCPYCGESIEILIDCSVPKQSYVEDCEVCCLLMQVMCTAIAGELQNLSVDRTNC